MNPTTAKEKAQALAAELKQKQQQQDTFKAPTPRPRKKKLSAKKKGPTGRTAATRTGRPHERENRRVNHSPSSSFERGSRSRTPVKVRPNRNSSSVNSITRNMEQRDRNEAAFVRHFRLDAQNTRTLQERLEAAPKSGLTKKQKQQHILEVRNADNRRAESEAQKRRLSAELKEKKNTKRKSTGDDEGMMQHYTGPVYSDKVTAIGTVNQTPLENLYAQVPPSFFPKPGARPVPRQRPHTYAEVSEGKKKKKRKGSTKSSTKKKESKKVRRKSK